MSNHPLFNYAEHTANELRRMLDLQTKLDPSGVEYAQLMRNMEVLAGSLAMYNDIADFFTMADAGITRVEIIPGGVAESEDDTPGCADEPDQFAEDKTDESEPAQVSPEKVYDPADVRAALVAARRAGTNVTELLKEFGVDNFGAFPAGKYGELMRRLGAG